MQHQVSANGQSVINSGITEDYRQALVEYIWNGFDAGVGKGNRAGGGNLPAGAEEQYPFF